MKVDPAVWLALAAGMLVAPDALAQAPTPDVRQYQANFITGTAPTIDGVVTAGEWDAAEAAAGDWRRLRESNTTVDLENSSFRVLWDDEALYVLFESTYDFWDTGSADAMNFNIDNLNLYIDPNKDGEPNTPDDPISNMMPFGGPDGYQIAFNQYVGDFSCGGPTAPCTAINSDTGDPILNSNSPGTGFGTFLEAHLDTPFGNQAGWAGFRDTQIHQNNVDFLGTDPGGVAEMKIPWTDIDAVRGQPGDADFDDSLSSVEGVENGEVWYWNMSRISSDSANFLPIWNWQSAQSFAFRPHGELIFAGKPAAFPADFDNDGDVDTDDYAAWQRNFATVSGASKADGDSDGDGDNDGKDYLAWQGGFGSPGNVGAAAVPEPTSALLLVLLAAGSLLRRPWR